MGVEHVVAHHVRSGIAHLIDSVFAIISACRFVRATTARRQSSRRPRIPGQASGELFVRLDLPACAAGVAFANVEHGAVVAEQGGPGRVDAGGRRKVERRK
jgi:hypothetical protein